MVRSKTRRKKVAAKRSQGPDLQSPMGGTLTSLVPVGLDDPFVGSEYLREDSC
jgi:hypothetical protein